MTTNNDFYRPETPFKHTTPPPVEMETRVFPTYSIAHGTVTVPRDNSDVDPDDIYRKAASGTSYKVTVTSEKHYNELTPGEAERLAILAEECGEIVRAVGKILRHGYESYHPGTPDHEGNRRELEKEIGDLSGIVSMMVRAGDIDGDVISKQAGLKHARIMQYAHHQETK